LGLTENERARIEDAVARAKAIIEQRRLAMATCETSSDGSSMTIQIPSLGKDGTVVYQSLLSEIVQVLGRDRFEVFSETCGESFDSSFDHFGADEVHYEIDLAHAVTTGNQTTYNIKGSSVEPDARGLGAHYMSSGTVSTTDVHDMFLRRFLFHVQ